jgi:hypothetical protein
MKITLKKRIFIPKPYVDFLRTNMEASVCHALGHVTSIDIPDRYDSGDNIQKLATYLYVRGALRDEDAATIVKNSNSRFSSIEELVGYWRSDVDELIDAEGIE